MIVAGPCAVESEAQIEKACSYLSQLGVGYVRGGCFKPRTKPDDFQGLGQTGLEIFRRVATKFNLRIVSEITDVRQIEDAAPLIDVIQIGARNMQNYDLLRECGKAKQPVLLKRGLAATLKEWYGAASYVERGGCPKLYLCERGHRTYLDHVRFMLDIAAIQDAREKGYPVIVDPSHAAGSRQFVETLTKAGLAAGADGLLIEAHPDPDNALSDANQQLSLTDFATLWEEIV